MRLIALILALSLSGCAFMQSPEGFAACKAADVATTVVALNSGKFHEANPLLKAFIGPHNFMPLVLVSVALYLVLKKLNEPVVTETATVVTCGVAVHNALLL